MRAASKYPGDTVRNCASGTRSRSTARPSTVNGTRANSPLNGSNVIAPVFVTVGTTTAAGPSARWNMTSASRLLKRFTGSVRRADSTRVDRIRARPPARSPKLFASIVMTMSSTTASATSELTSPPRMRWPPPVVPRPLPERLGHVHAGGRERGDDAEEHTDERSDGRGKTSGRRRRRESRRTEAVARRDRH